MTENKLKFKVRHQAIDFKIKKHKAAVIKSKPPKVNPMIAFMNAPAEKAKASTYRDYIRQGGVCMCIVFITMLLL